jgi:hypothetical protein
MNLINFTVYFECTLKMKCLWMMAVYSRLRHPIHGSSHRSETGHLTRTFNEWSIDFVKDAMGWLLRHTKSRHALIVGGGLILMNTLIIQLGIPGEMCRCMENNSCFLYTLLRKMNLIVFCSWSSWKSDLRVLWHLVSVDIWKTIAAFFTLSIERWISLSFCSWSSWKSDVTVLWHLVSAIHEGEIFVF